MLLRAVQLSADNKQTLHNKHTAMESPVVHSTASGKT